MSLVRQHFNIECENALNNQINMELFASYVYMSMSFYFNRDDVALPGLSGYFKKASDEERDHAMKLMSYQNKRGGNIMLQNINAPEKTNWGTANETMKAALALEKDVNESLLKLHALASNNEDANLQDFLDGFLQEQIDSIKEIANYVTTLERVGEGLGVYTFDQQLLKDSD